MDVVATDPYSLFDMITRSTTTAKGVLLLLLVFSMASWAIILSKFYVYRKAKVEDGRFLAVFSKSESLINIYNYSKGQCSPWWRENPIGVPAFRFHC